MSASVIYEPELEAADGLFPALLDGLQLFRARVEGVDVGPEGEVGRDRARLLSLVGHSGLIVDVVTATLTALVDILIWLRDAIAEYELWIGQVDALFAIIELLGVGLDGLGEAIEAIEWPAELSVAGADFEVVGEAVADFGDLVPPSVIPPSTTLLAIVSETEALVGTAEPATTGSLQQLLHLLLGMPAP